MTTSYEIRAIAPDVLSRLRETDDAGHSPRLLVEDGQGGNPLRCCLGRTRPHEKFALVSYAPLRRWAEEAGAEPGPYNEVGPVFIHTRACDGPGSADVPEGVCGERRVLRAYNAAGDIIGGRYLSPADPSAIEAGLAELYGDPQVATVHLRAVERGCFLMETRRRVPSE